MLLYQEYFSLTVLGTTFWTLTSFCIKEKYLHAEIDLIECQAFQGGISVDSKFLNTYLLFHLHEEFHKHPLQNSWFSRTAVGTRNNTYVAFANQCLGLYSIAIK